MINKRFSFPDRYIIPDLVGPSKTTVNAGSDATLSCTYTEVSDQPTVVWYETTDSGNSMVDSSLYSSASGVSELVISNANKTDNGETYFCSFSYTVDGVTESFNSSSASLYVRGKIQCVLSTIQST